MSMDHRWFFNFLLQVFCDNYLDGGYHVPYAHKGLASGLELDSYSTTVCSSSSSFWNFDFCIPNKILWLWYLVWETLIFLLCRFELCLAILLLLVLTFYIILLMVVFTISRSLPPIRKIFEKVSIQRCGGGSAETEDKIDRLGSEALYAFIYPNFMINR